MTSHRAELEQQARAVLGEHYSCEDCWYSCPLSEDGCCDDRQPKECTCGLDENVQKVADLLAAHEADVLEEVAKLIEESMRPGSRLAMREQLIDYLRFKAKERRG